MRCLPLLLAVLALASCHAQAARTLKGVGSGAGMPSQQCLSAWNQAVDRDGPCGAAATLESCCPALKSLGLSCMEDLVTAIAADPSYSNTLDVLQKTLNACAAAASGTGGSSSGSGSGSSTDEEQCFQDLATTLQTSCLNSMNACCPALERLGGQCLQTALDSLSQDASTQAAFIQLLQACGWSVQSSGASYSATAPNPSGMASRSAVETDSDASPLAQLHHARCPLCGSSPATF